MPTGETRIDVIDKNAVNSSGLNRTEKWYLHGTYCRSLRLKEEPERVIPAVPVPVRR
uniref:Uncharacterized protein n=1 Tax=uncultured Thiotrichaceae bacterium TaxID=298394 RepID=A0A6S6UKS6_9GAMM|nr:MAG: Unknown protein [uncultured Thiotrichaceae bacterium]